MRPISPDGQHRYARTAETDSTRLCTASALACTGTDQLELELSQAAQDSQHHAPMRSCSVRPCVGQRLEAGLCLARRGGRNKNPAWGNAGFLARGRGIALESRI